MNTHIKKTIPVLALALLCFFTGFTQSKLSSAKTERPFEGVDVPFSQWTYDAQTCGKFVYTPSGTSICFPPDALETESGEPVIGMVNVAYREFHSPMSILVSGISMEYTENGRQQHLETGGMYELRAYQNGNPLQLKAGMQANVKMRSFTTRDDFEFFKYDDEGGTWEKRNDGGTRIAKRPEEVETQEAYWGEPTESGDDFADDFEDWGDNDWGDSDWGWEEGPIDTAWYQIDQFANDIFYSGTVEELGIYNYDAIMKQDPIVRIQSQFFIPNEKDREHLKVYVVYKETNSVFYFSPADFKDQFYLYTDRPAKIFAVLPGNRVAKMDENELASLDLSRMNGKKHIFKMEAPSAPFDSQAEVQEYLNFY